MFGVPTVLICHCSRCDSKPMYSQYRGPSLHGTTPVAPIAGLLSLHPAGRPHNCWKLHNAGVSHIRLNSIHYRGNSIHYILACIIFLEYCWMPDHEGPASSKETEHSLNKYCSFILCMLLWTIVQCTQHHWTLPFQHCFFNTWSCAVCFTKQSKRLP